MLVAGMDVSGDKDSTNYKFLGIVIGTHQSIMSLSSDLGFYPEHMSRTDDKEKSDIISKLRFDSINRIAYCIKLDRAKIIQPILDSRRARKTRKGEILRTYN